MATVVAEIIYKATEKGMDGVKRKLNTIDKSSKKTTGSVVGLSGAMKLAIPLAVIAAAGKLTGVLSDMGREAAKVGDDLVKTASKMGLTTKALQEYRFAAEEAGIKQSTLDMGLQRFTRRFGEAQLGTGELKKGLDILGISITDQNGKVRKSSDVFEEYLSKMANVKDESLKLVLSTKAFDSEGAVFVNMAGNLESSKKKMQEMGIIIDDKILKKLAHVNNDLGVMAKQQETLSTEIGAAFSFVTLIIEKWNVSVLQTVKTVLQLTGLMDVTLNDLKRRSRTQIGIIKQLTQAAEIETNSFIYEQKKKGLAKQVKVHEDTLAKISKIEIQNAKDVQKIIDENKGKPDTKLSLPPVGGKPKGSSGTSDVAKQVKKDLRDSQTAAQQLNDIMLNSLIEYEQDAIQQIRLRFDLEVQKLDELVLKTKAGTEERAQAERDFTTIHALLVEERLRSEDEAKDTAHQKELTRIEDEKQKNIEKYGGIGELMYGNINLQQEFGDIALDSIDTMADAFADFATGAEKDWGKFFKSFMNSIAKMIIKLLVMKALEQALGALGKIGTSGTSSLGTGGSLVTSGAASTGFSSNAAKNAISPTFTTKFAKGGAFTNSIVNRPTKFAFGGVLGEMGEAGPEAIMPLSRGSDGSLGVKVVGNTTNSTNENNNNSKQAIINNYNTTIQMTSTGDAKQDGKKAAEAAIKVIAKQTIANELRPGGIINRSKSS